MYSSFSKETTVLYVTDGQDKTLAIKDYFRLDASKVKKAYVKRLIAICKKKGYSDGDAKAEDLQEAGKYLVNFLPTQARSSQVEGKLRANGFRIYRLSLEMTKTGIRESTELVGESQP